MILPLKSPTTWGEFFVDSVWTAESEYVEGVLKDSNVKALSVHDPVATDELIQKSVGQLRDHVMMNTAHMKKILKKAFNICIEACPKLVDAVSEKMKAMA
jgi:hypothetical protein